jgi:hypothetical protein
VVDVINELLVLRDLSNFFKVFKILVGFLKILELFAWLKESEEFLVLKKFLTHLKRFLDEKELFPKSLHILTYFVSWRLHRHISLHKFLVIEVINEVSNLRVVRLKTVIEGMVFLNEVLPLADSVL